MEFVTEKYDSLLAKGDVRDKSVAALTTQVSSLETLAPAQASLIQKLQAEVNDAEQYSTDCNLETDGLKACGNEDLKATVSD